MCKLVYNIILGRYLTPVNDSYSAEYYMHKKPYFKGALCWQMQTMSRTFGSLAKPNI